MHLFLFCPDGIVRTLFLPKNIDGRFGFDALAGREELPFYAEADCGSWVLYCGNEAEFCDPDGTAGGLRAAGRAMPLEDRAFKYLKYHEKIYSAYAELDNEGDNALVPYRFDPAASVFTIGRNPENSIVYTRPNVSRRHASIERSGDRWEIVDRNSTNGVYVNGLRVQRKALELGDTVFIMGLSIVVGTDYFAINNANGRVTMNTPHIKMITPRERNAADFAKPRAGGAGERAFDRPPRKLIKVEAKPIEIEMPPMKIGANRLPLLLRLSSPLAMGGQALLTGNIVSAFTGMFLPTMSQGMSDKDRKDYEARRTERYGAYLKDKQNEIETERINEITLLNKAHPDVTEVLAFAGNKERLWERRKIDEDFLSVRIGTGELPLIAERVYEKKKLDLEDDELVDKMYRLASKPVTLPNAPVLLSFIGDRTVGVKGRRTLIRGFVRNIILQLAATHSYDELKICVLAGEDSAAELDFVRYLRHNWDDEMNVRFFASQREDTQPIADYFKKREEDYFGGNRNPSKSRIPKNAPVFIIFALDKTLFESLEFLKNVLDEPEYCGISILSAFDGLPKECTKIIEAETEASLRLIDLRHPENPEIGFRLDPYSAPAADAAVKELYGTKLRSRLELSSLPSMLTFLEMYRVGRVEHLNPLARWKENNPIKSLAAPVGVGTDGSLFMLDLHEKRQGPHGLIAGMTGSGKSEFIITYILSMAVNYSPEEVAFILIDYKGGGLTDAFEDRTRGIHLPHVVGTITNLDGAAIRRSLMSINSELKRRQSVFKQAKSQTNAGTMDIYDYQKLYRAGKVDEPMPHLFIISDEFAELKKQEPEFMDELISTARIGRSLGVHLILATQKPGGVVNDQIWSNTRFRVCLKVQDRGDSMEMLKRPEAAELKQTGRFYLQVGYNEYFAIGQSAWCGAGYIPQDGVAKEDDTSVEFVDTAGRTILSARTKAEKPKAECKQVVSIVRCLSDLAARENIKTRRLWTDPLPETVEYGSLPEAKGEGITAAVGLIDDPEFQKQYPLRLDMQSFRNMLLVGGSGSGKSTLLRTLLCSLAERYSPDEVNIYIVDLSSGALGALAALPHCGAYLTEDNEADLDRLLKLVRDMTAERKKLFADAEVFGFDAYRKIAKLPLAVFVIDSWMNISSFRKGQEYGFAIADYMRDAANCGIRFILSINHINEIGSRAKQETDYRIMLQPQDKFDYNDVLNIRGSMLPSHLAGRGVCVIDGRALEFQTAVISAVSETGAVKALAAKLREKYPAAAVRRLPMLAAGAEYGEFLASFEKDRIPLGFSLDTMQPVSMPLQQLYTASLFFGNPAGIRPVLWNLLLAFEREDADVVIMRRRADTVFDSAAEKKLADMFAGHYAVLDCSAEGAAQLDDRIIANITETKVMHRNDFCALNGIPATDAGRTKKAARYIREHSKPLMILFESFGDFLGLGLKPEQKEEFSALFEKIRGYNVYFFGCFYPEDESRSSKPLFKSFSKEDFALLFGGRYSSAWCTQLPSDLRRADKPDPQYDRCVLKYRGECHRLLMPCGELSSAGGDPDDADII